MDNTGRRARRSESESALRDVIGNRLDEVGATLRKVLLQNPAATIRRAHGKLVELGLAPDKIATHAQLLCRDPDTLQRNADLLRRLGLAPAAIAGKAQLLGMNPRTVRGNYDFLRRFFTRDTICKNAGLLGNSRETVFSSVQFLSGLKIDHEKYPCVHTTAACKRRKVAELARARFGCSNFLSKDERMEMLRKARSFVKTYPTVLRLREKEIRARFAKAA